MSTRSRPCPSCGAQLEQSRRKDLSALECPVGHGVGVFLIDAWGTLQRDELETLWSNAKEAPASSMRSPLSGEPMVEVTFPVDPDTSSRVSAANEMTVEVDRENYFAWFELHEIEAMPTEDDKRGTKEPGMVGIDRMDGHANAERDVFVDLTPEDLAESSNSPIGFLSSLAQRLRTR